MQDNESKNDKIYYLIDLQLKRTIAVGMKDKDDPKSLIGLYSFSIHFINPQKQGEFINEVTKQFREAHLQVLHDKPLLVLYNEPPSLVCRMVFKGLYFQDQIIQDTSTGYEELKQHLQKIVNSNPKPLIIMTSSPGKKNISFGDYPFIQ